MKYSTLNEIQTTKDTVSAFSGYNHNLSIDKSEFYDMFNMTGSYYPLASPRKTRATYEYTYTGTHSPNGLISKDNLCYVDGTTLYINRSPVTALTLTDSPKQLVSMGAYLIIMPDKKYVNTANLSDYGDIEASFTSVGGFSYELCELDGTAYTITFTQDEEPKTTETVTVNNGDYWIDTSSTPHTLKVYSETSAVWVDVATTYVKIKAKNIAKDFKEYDGVLTTGLASVSQLSELNNKVNIIYGAYHDSNEGTNDYIIMTCIVDATGFSGYNITLKRQMPKLDFIIESENRLWGCRYGTDIYNNVVNEIYACKLGDFKNWNCFMGLASDSYTASCGTDGAFTGAITHLGYPLFFKETCLHKVYGNYPSNYQITTTACNGVQRGAGNSLAIVGTTLFYKSRAGVCAYDGSLPTEISAALGEDRYTGLDSTNNDYLRNGAAAGAYQGKYYISMKSDTDNTWNMFVFDTSKSLWHREDNTHAVQFCESRGEFYFIDATTKEIKIVDKDSTEKIHWFITSGVLGTTYANGRGTSQFPENKYVARINIRMSLAENSKAHFFIQYNSDGKWHEVSAMKSTSLRTFTVSLRPTRCDHFNFQIAGTGDAKIYSITKLLEKGSDVNL